MKKFLGLMVGSAALALAGCGGGSDQVEEDTMASDVAEPVAEDGMMAEGDDADAMVEGDDTMAADEESSEAALSAEDMEVGAEDTDFDPTGNPIGPGEAQD